MRLNATHVKQTKEPGRHSDGRGAHGLALVVHERAGGGVSKHWVQRIRIKGRETNLGLGSWPAVSLAAARALALENVRVVAAGGDPRLHEQVPTLREMAERVIEERRHAWTDTEKREHRRSEHQWRRSLEIHVGPLMDRPVDEITTPELARALKKVWAERPETGRRVRGRIKTIMDKATTEGYRPDNPTPEPAGLARQPSAPQRHIPSVPHAELGAVIAAVHASQAWPATKLALEFLVLTATRAAEVRGAVWGEMDTQEAVWTIPANRYKTRRDPHGLSHPIPLRSPTGNCRC